VPVRWRNGEGPEDWLIDRNHKADLATFRIPDVILAPANLYPHYPTQWPTDQAREGEVVIYGGYPGSLRGERGGNLGVTVSDLRLDGDLRFA
jgi:hypothetical protein